MEYFCKMSKEGYKVTIAFSDATLHMFLEDLFRALKKLYPTSTKHFLANLIKEALNTAWEA